MNERSPINPLIRRVRRHAGLTTLFRRQAVQLQPGTSSVAPLVLGQAMPAPVLPTDDWTVHTPDSVISAAAPAGVPSVSPLLGAGERPIISQDEDRPPQPAPVSSPRSGLPVETEPVIAPGVAAPATMPAAASPAIAPTAPAPRQQQAGGYGASTAAPVVQAQFMSPGGMPTAAMAQPSTGQRGSAPVGTPASLPPAASPVRTQDPVQPTATPASSAQPAAATPPLSEEDRNWTRLQAIYRRHKELEASRHTRAITSTTAPVQMQPMQRGQTGAAQPQPAQRSPGETRSVGQIDVAPDLDRNSRTQEAVAQPDTPIAASQEPDQVAAHHLVVQRQEDTVETIPSPPNVAPAALPPAPRQPAGEATMTARPSSAAQRVVVASPQQPAAQPGMIRTPTQALDASVGEVRTVVAQQMPGRQAAELMPSEPDELDSSGLSGSEPLPLEAVWPVQRSGKPATSAEPTPTSQSESLAELGTATRMTTPVFDDQIRQRLEQIKTGQPTESTVDMVTPRRPRPRPRAQTQTDTGMAPPSVQRTEQVSALQPAVDQEPVATNWVESEVGPLPADLWYLIGETPPSPMPPATTTQAQSSTMPAPLAEPVKAEPMTSSPVPERPLTYDQGAEEADLAQSSNDLHPTTTLQRIVDSTIPERSATPEHTAPASATDAAQDHTVGAAAVLIDDASVVTAPDVQPAGLLRPAAETTGQTDNTGLPLPEQPSPIQRVAAASEPPVPRKRIRAANQPRQQGATSPSEANAGEMVQRQAGQDTVASAAPGIPALPTAALVQRQATEEAPAASTASAETPALPPATSAGAPALATVDTDELARQVYAHIKRQLLVERERIRH